MGGNVAIPRLNSCPKCKGRLLLEKDNYGLYQQCLQCGYLHDLQIFPVLGGEEIEEEEELASSQCSIEKVSNHTPQDTPQLNEYSPDKALTVPHDLEVILSSLHKGH
jgi:hypothetical protein